MSSKIHLDNINIKNAQSCFLDPIEWQVTFSNNTTLSEPLQWKIIYVGSACNEDCDQILEEFEIPPITSIQTMKFQLQCPPPNYNLIPKQELYSVTAIILTVSYKSQQFIRVGYYIHYQFSVEQNGDSVASLSPFQIVKKLKRTILCDKPRVTKFNIKWEQQQINNIQNNSTLFNVNSEGQQVQAQSLQSSIKLQSQQYEQYGHQSHSKQSTVSEKSHIYQEHISIQNDKDIVSSIVKDD